MPDDFAQDMRNPLTRTELSRRGFFVAGTLATGFALAARPIQAQSVITTDTVGLTAGEVQIPVAGGTIPAYHAMPASSGPFPTVVVAHEIFGVHEHIKDVCRRFAKLGYLAVAPEYFARHGDVSKMADAATIRRNVVSKVTDAQLLADTDATFAWAAANAKGDAEKRGITGFCWGGRLVWLYAAYQPNLKAGVAWYGRLVGDVNEANPKHPLDLASDMKAPVLGLYGAADSANPNDTVEKMQAALKAAGKPSEIVLYPDTPHAFHADYRPSYRKQQAEDGWARMQAWFKRHGVA